LPPHDAEDVVCEVFVIAWRNLSKIPHYELGWLLRTTRNVMANQARSAARRQALAHKMSTSTVPLVPDHAGEVADRDQVTQVLAMLSPKDQEVLSLLIIEDLSTAELAVALGCRPHTAYMRAQRAKARLAALYDGHESSPGNPASNNPHTLAHLHTTVAVIGEG
jgi:RNA polymerase sigma-70 factor (ECF subfamily)